MIINSFQITEDLQLQPLDSEEAVKATGSSGARTWIDLQDFEPDELEDWLDRLECKRLSKQLCLEARDRSGFYPLKNEILVVIPFLSAHTGDKHEVDYLALLCREHLLVTAHRTSIMTPQRRAEIQDSHEWLAERSISALVSALMNDLSLESVDSTTELKKTILALEERMDRDANDVQAEEILDVRSKLLAVASVVSDQLPPVQSLSTTDKGFFKLTDSRDFMNCALANLHAAERTLEWLDRRIGDLRSGFQMNAQDKTNRRLNLLTILTAIFTPITLLAGIWGMNFETMPELSFPFAYPAALVLMVIIGTGMYQFFRRNGWFD
ncbi:Magnesium transport protein CorA [Planctomycetes bacterium CA13]|uniref:Magnesium transport protein CorA n=1 Tax=Novipirellula herctigrandis TaxID=2527986 RepID=A0A5C5Z292_9BACT|nr:Magnesium transport protein CorA [Planctomycetes bacterium CA13]